jgi:hypothetical protein
MIKKSLMALLVTLAMISGLFDVVFAKKTFEFRVTVCEINVGPGMIVTAFPSEMDDYLVDDSWRPRIMKRLGI